MAARADQASWHHLARKLDWTPSAVSTRELFPEALSGTPWLEHEAWADWDEPFKTRFEDYVVGQDDKERGVAAVAALLGRAKHVARLDEGWLAATKLHAATLPLAEFAAVLGNLRAARFGRDGAWRTMSALGALDELRHTQVPLEVLHPLLRHDAQFDWAHRFYHTNNWVAIAARHAFDELLVCADPIELAIGTNFVFETGFTNLQFLGLASLAEGADDRLFEAMLTSIQTDEARHAQIGRPVLETVAKHDRARAQYLVDKWFWRSWQLFAVVTGLAMDYLTPVARRGPSFREFVQEWVVEQFLVALDRLGLERPWYWATFEEALANYHHMIYASAYSYRASVWFDFVLPGPRERAWLQRKYPDSFAPFDTIWQHAADRWAAADPGVDFAVHGLAIPTFCSLCQLVLSHGTPARNDARVCMHEGEPRVFCSAPCQWIFEQEPERYGAHKDIVARVLAGEAPANLVEFLRNYSDLEYDEWGKDAHAGVYPWLDRARDRGGRP